MVFITAAWGLRRLAVPRTLDAMFDKFRRETEKAQQAGSLGIVVGRQVSQLIEAFGLMGYAQAEPLLRKYIPKGSPFDAECRAAAVWTLGHLHAGQPDAELVRLFVGRLSDVESMEPEDVEGTATQVDSWNSSSVTVTVSDPLVKPSADAVIVTV